MKNLSLVLNLVLVVAVAVLFYMQLSNPAISVEEKKENDSTSVFSEVTLAYVNSDSLLTHYAFMKEIQEKLENKQQRLEREYRNRAEGLQREIETFQRTAGNLTMAQARAQEEDLMKKQQNLMRYQENLSQELMRDEAAYNSDLYDRVSAFLKHYGDEKGLQLVLTYSKGSGVLYGHKSLDITNEVIEGLNKEYNEAKNVAK